ncbi:DUF6682 family protein [Ottowia sp. VDI28]|uniref:phage adaptor protein n=1 Tax=Ottowia sp. VDI28 TaxID=3133968 RepID=UPI003C2CA688
MTLGEMIALYRADAVDDAEGRFCSDELLTIYANEAQDEACRRGQLLRDSTSPMCSVSFAASDESVRLDAAIIRVLRSHIGTADVDVVDAELMDCTVPGWQFNAGAMQPQRLVTGMTTGELFLWPKPMQPGTIRLTVQRLPKKRLASKSETPEIRRELHPALVAWMLYRAYSREDTDLYNDTKAAVHLAKFEAEFGRKVSGRNEEWVRAPSATGPGPIA